MKLRSMSVLVGMTVLAACSTPTPPRPAVTASAEVAPQAATAPAPVVATGQSAPVATSGDPTVELHNYARSQGYRSVTRNGKQVWCRQEPTLGSHFETVYCLTDAVLADQKRMTEQNQEEMIHNYRPNCVGPTCNF